MWPPPLQTTTPPSKENFEPRPFYPASAPLHGGPSMARDSNLRYADHEFVTITSRLPRPWRDSRLNNAFRFVEWAQNEIAVVPDFHKRILFNDEAHFWLNGYVNKQNCRIWSEANPQVYVETPLNPEKLTVWCALWAGRILLQKR
ncbi:hypothetical protein TNCV_440701 [Trichonephila clavipes]|nr:hypothetical protein TNCV_440701 [Trichonephila clavipes]